MELNKFLNEVCPLIKDYGWAYYFAESTQKKGQEKGLDIFSLYFLGRGGVMGDVDPPMVIAAFGYFNPRVITQMWTQGRQKINPREAATLYFQCAEIFGEEHFAGIENLEEFNAACEKVLGAADATSLMLFAGAKAMPLSENVAGRAMQLISILREFRGSAHLLAVKSVGLNTKTAHFLARPNDFAMFGWGETDIPEITNREPELLAAAELLTDEIVMPAYSILNDNERKLIVNVMNEISEILKGEN